MNIGVIIDVKDPTITSILVINIKRLFSLSISFIFFSLFILRFPKQVYYQPPTIVNQFLRKGKK